MWEAVIINNTDERTNMKFDINSLIEHYFLLVLEVTKIHTQLLRKRAPTESNQKQDLQCQFLTNDIQVTFFNLFSFLPPALLK